ncbi:hypothetical protein PRIPAC_94503 [Pristionchus pacificus]|uniref:Transcription initiation factor IIA subunit 2 n=1 Tax=Pristionchus pacificus TaxID=54126 RepID=A0A454XM24_PRIPA|nr:hypothetical protein PRIPAC_94503 [Pristionchus pacificus]|eukprot:PDM68280.1 hypothetical protein PRIPAC_46324 [Pristionchus pacificus]
MATTEYQLYRETTMGMALTEVLDQMIEDHLIPKTLAMKVLGTFDKNMNKALAQRAKTKYQFKADKLVAYRYCDNVWTFVMADIEFRDYYRTLDGKHPRVKFVACDGRMAITGVPAPH